MSNVPSPGLLRSIKSLADKDLGSKLRLAGRVLHSSPSDSSLVLESGAVRLAVDCRLPMAAARLADGLPRVADRIIVLGYLHPCPVLVNKQLAHEHKYLLEAIIIKQTIDLDLEAWDNSLSIDS